MFVLGKRKRNAKNQSNHYFDKFSLSVLRNIYNHLDIQTRYSWKSSCKKLYDHFGSDFKRLYRNPHIVRLPIEIWHRIFSFMDYQSFVKSASTCRYLYDVSLGIDGMSPTLIYSTWFLPQKKAPALKISIRITIVAWLRMWNLQRHNIKELDISELRFSRYTLKQIIDLIDNPELDISKSIKQKIQQYMSIQNVRKKKLIFLFSLNSTGETDHGSILLSSMVFELFDATFRESEHRYSATAAY